ncbi:hypothetical protein GPJ56_006321 [Histomonas meleagridis]|uniref:uncharacterized protein n=1 Tax=Histomonas meleagridis TaxID=135588 RepID=UPI00355AAC6A|nr:hypothetical protein GPJ56_006321 [Histomonas meleagridis]KAH0796863.1 hypothetical protein GO595_010756 [Histomonas meleagridis]
MDPYLNQILEIYNVIKAGIDNTAIAQATQLAEKIYQDPQSIQSLLTILSNNYDLFCRKNAAIALRRAVIVHNQMINDQTKTAMVQQLLQVLQNETNPDLQKNIKQVISKLKTIQSQQLILEFANRSLESGNQNLLVSSLMLVKSLDLDELPQFTQFFISLIRQGLNLPSPIPALDLAFRIGNGLLSQEQEVRFFMAQVWNQMLAVIPQCFGNQYMLAYFDRKIYDSFENDAEYADPASIIDQILPLVGNPEVPIEAQPFLAKMVGSAIGAPGASQELSSTEIVPEIIQRFFRLSAALFNPQDQLSLSGVDVFEDICEAFTFDEFFLNTLINATDELYSNPNTRPGIILSFGHLISFKSEDISEQFSYIVPLFAQSCLDQTRLVRDSAAYAISELSEEYFKEIDEYFEELATSILKSLTIEYSQDMILALTKLFEYSSNTDPIFEDAYKLLITWLANSPESVQQILFPCLSELCIHSKSLIQQHFEEVFQLMNQFIFNTDKQYLAEPSIDCLSHLAITCRELFAPHALQFAQFIAPFMVNEQESLQILALQAFGRIVQFHSSKIEALLPQIIPVLLQIGAKDLGPQFVAEYFRFQQLESTGEATFYLEIEEDNKDKISPYAIPALALSLLASISYEFPSILAPIIGDVINEIQLQAKLASQDAMDITCKAMVYFIEAIAKTDIDHSQIALIFSEIALNMIKTTNELETAGESFNVLAEIVRAFGAYSLGQNFNVLCEVLQDFFNGKLICQEDEFKYNEELFYPIVKMFNEMIASFGPKAPELLGKFVPVLLQMLESKKSDFISFAIQTLGQFVEDCATQLPVDILQKIFQIAVTGLQRNNDECVYVLNQFTTGAPEFLKQYTGQLIQILFTKIKQKHKKSVSYLSFLDNVVALIGEIRRNVLGDEFPIQQFLVPCLNHMPAVEDQTVNLDMMNFYVWLAEKTNCQPMDLFASVAIKLFAAPREEIGGIAEDDSGILQRVLQILFNILKQLPNAEEFVTVVCNGDAIKVQRVKETLANVPQ